MPFGLCGAPGSFQWSPSCQSAFNNLKDALTSAPILKYPDFSPSAKPFNLYTDASATGIGGVLEQSGHVIAYVSRALILELQVPNVPVNPPFSEQRAIVAEHDQ